MKSIILLAASLAMCAAASAQSIGTQAGAASDSFSGAQVNAPTNIRFGDSTSGSKLSTTPSVYVAPAVMGGANNCGQSNTASLGKTGIGLGFAVAGESDPCNAREDTFVAHKLGFTKVAEMRFFCFGESANRMAYEASGYVCPVTGTAKGIETASNDRAAARQAALFSTN